MDLIHDHDKSLMILSFIIAIFASYTALDLASCISTSQGKLKWIWLLGGSIAMGVGIWSMHFVGMLAFHVPGISISYDIPLLILSIIVAILASLLALYLVSMRIPTQRSYIAGSLTMGGAIAGMHYIGIASMRMDAAIKWNFFVVGLSILIAICASYVALFLAFKLRDNFSLQGFIYRGLSGVLMGFAIAGMHYTAMAAMSLYQEVCFYTDKHNLLATDGLAAAVIVATLLVLGIALSGSNIDRALTKKITINNALKASIEARDEFFSIVSHELKTPLTSVKLQNEMILRRIEQRGFEKEKIVSMLENNGNNIIRIHKLVDDMLDISRLSTSRLTLHKEVFDLGLLVNEVIERLQPLLDEAGCKLIMLQEDRITGEWDRFRMEQVVTNILTNAAKYAANKPIKVKIFKQHNSAVISFQDEGPGIDPKDQTRIFQRFERAEATGKTKGLGLGLFIVKEILQMHDGDIIVKSQPSAGTEFIITLPIS